MEPKESPDQISKRNRGPHPRDAVEFTEKHFSNLYLAAKDFSLLLSKGYTEVASLKLVGDHFKLSARQRTAVRRSSCTEDQKQSRQSKDVAPRHLAGKTVLMDGFNIIVTLESALSGAVLLKGQDTLIRDLGSVHGTYRHVRQTDLGLQEIASWFRQTEVSSLEIYLDSPVSNSGRLANRIREFAETEELDWKVETVPNPDKILAASSQIVATADAWILDECQNWTNIVSDILESKTDLWIVNFSS